MLLRYEFQKVLKNKTTLLCICFFLMVNAVFAFYTVQKAKSQILYENTRTAAVLERLDGTLTKEKVDFVTAEYGRLHEAVSSGNFSTAYDENTYTGYTYGDYNLFSALKEELDRIYLYPQILQTAMQNLEGNIELYSSAGNSYQARQSENMRALYSDREILEFHDYNGTNAYLEYDISYLFVLLGVAVILSGVFVQEKEAGVDILARTTVNGKRKLLSGKIGAGLLLTLGYSLLFFLEDFCVFSVCFGSLHFGVPLFYLPDYAYTTFNGSVGAFALVLALMKTLGACGVATVCLTFSNWSQTYLKAIGASVLFVLILVFWAQLQNDVLLNPIFLVQAQTMFRVPRYVGVFGLQLPAVTAILLWNAAVVLVFIGILFLKSGEKHARIHGRS